MYMCLYGHISIYNHGTIKKNGFQYKKNNLPMACGAIDIDEMLEKTDVSKDNGVWSFISVAIG